MDVLGTQTQETDMRFMILIKATKDSEAGVLPSPELLEQMGKFNEELVKAGIMQAGEGLQPSSKGARVKFVGNQCIVTDGPFPETKELLAGFWMWKCKSKQEAIDWVRRRPIQCQTRRLRSKSANLRDRRLRRERDARSPRAGARLPTQVRRIVCRKPNLNFR